LQSVDNRIEALEELKGDLPQQVHTLRTELENSKKEYEQIKTELDEAKKQKLHGEGELEDLKTRLNKYQEQLYQVTTNKEYDAITMEIDTIKERMSDSEINILEAMEMEENRTEDELRLRNGIESLEDNLKSKEEELKKKISATEAESIEFQKQREQLATAIKRPILYQYERIRKGIGNTAVAEVLNSTCAGCFATIPPQKVVEIKTMNQLILCESCGRILVYKNEKDVVTT
jgi:predicted  nucleic acid-binding Zn-ribbon protein